MTTMESDSYAYPGDELELFAGAVNWKAYWAERIAEFVVGDVLEVGAGIGANTGLLRKDEYGRWVCVEPDRDLFQRLVAGVESFAECHNGTIDVVSEDERFDTVLYLDVLEHIEDHEGELAKAGARLKSGGHVVMLGPAHQFLWSPFDAYVGHVRRYSRRNLPNVDSGTLQLVHTEYLDSVGICASLANRVLLQSSVPNTSQIQLWDRYMVPVSRALDRFTGRNLGKSILAVWRKV